MRTYLLLLITLFLAGVANAQNQAPDHYNEVGIYAGIAPFTNPNNPQYTGDTKKLPYMLAANYHYNFTESWQAGLDVAMTKWEATGTQKLDSLYGQPLGSQDIKYLYADRAWSVTARINHVMPHYDDYRMNTSNFYYGVSAGVLFTINDGSLTYGQFNGQHGEQYRYVTEYHYEPGAGYTFGLQVGYNYYVTDHIGFNAEFAPRFAHINVVDNRIASKNTSYDEYYFPVLVGIRYRF